VPNEAHDQPSRGRWMETRNMLRQQRETWLLDPSHPNARLNPVSYGFGRHAHATPVEPTVKQSNFQRCDCILLGQLTIAARATRVSRQRACRHAGCTSWLVVDLTHYGPHALERARTPSWFLIAVSNAESVFWGDAASAVRELPATEARLLLAVLLPE
jgi:hypothetical protein